MYSGEPENKYGVDVTKVTIKLTYFGLIFGVLSPGVFFAVGYALEGSERQLFSDPDGQQLFFWIFLSMSVIVGVAAFFLKKVIFTKPLINSERTFVSDFAEAMHLRSLILFGVTELIGVFGLAYFFMGGDLDGLMLFCLITVVVFQIIRPRPGFVEEILADQERLVSQGKFARLSGR